MLKKLKSFSLPEIEKQVLAFWNEHRVFEKSIEERPAKRTFVFYEGPPTANGRPGFHHVLARAFKDIILRYKTMRGYRVPRRAGWDTHGLPVELEVEKALGLKSKKEIEAYGIAKFNQVCKESVWKYKDEWEKLTERIGFWLDMEHPYVTYENSYVETLWSILAEVWKKKLLYRGHKVVPWCARCGTALSSHEVALGYRSVEEASVYLRFRVKASTKDWGNTSVLSWTTTPWTLPGNVALAVNRRENYICVPDPELKNHWLVLAQRCFERLVAEGLFPAEFRELPPEKFDIFKGEEMLGIEYEPLFDIAPLKKEKTAYKVYPADFVTTTDGTGVVHTAVMYGEDDYLLGKEVGLPEFHTVGLDGKFVKEVPGLAGMRVKEKESDEKIFEHLKAKNYLLKTENYTHDYPFCWRCDSPLLYYARDSWFIRMSALREELQKENEKINWIPAHLKEGRFGEWLREVKDWAISRERYWGTPLPLWVCDSCGHTHAVGSVEDLEKRLPKPKNRYILVRHGEAESNVKGVLASWPEKEPHHLTLAGRTQVERTARELAEKHVDAILSSDLTRAKETADIIAAATSAPVVFDERLRERAVGDLNGESIDAFRALQTSEIDRFERRPPGGESMNDLRVRALAFLEKMEKTYQGKTLLVVGHGDPLWMLRAVLGGWTNKELVSEGTVAAEGYPKKGESAEVSFRNIPRDEVGALDLHRPWIDEISFPCGECQRGTMRRVPEVIDVWFDSGAMPFAQDADLRGPDADQRGNKQDADRRGEGQRESALVPRSSAFKYPADFISEAMDQTRGWFYTLLAIGVLLGKGTPFKNVISVGLVLDKNGQKMSKSKGNIVSPWDMVEKYGADAVRWYFYTVNPPGEPKLFDEAELQKVLRQFILLIYNSFVFYDTYAKPTTNNKQQTTNVLDQWILVRLDGTVETATGALDGYDVGAAGRAIADFADDLSRWYIRRSRRRFSVSAKGFGGQATVEDYEAASATLRSVLETLARLLAPFTPFFAEALWQSLKPTTDNRQPTTSVHLTDWPEVNRQPTTNNRRLLADMAEIRRLASLALAKRAEAGIKVRQPLAKLEIKNQISKIPTKSGSLPVGGRGASGGKNVDAELQKILAEEINVKEIIVRPDLKEELELDTTITHELLEEGWLRELTRAVQGLRQDAGLEPKDTITLFLEVPGELMHVVEARRAAFLRDVGAESLEYRRPEHFAAELATVLDSPPSTGNEGWKMWIGLKKK